MHRDCKASNLLLNRRGIVKLADFGLATNYRTRERFGCNVVTLWYRAPELLLGDERYGPAVDVWSAGVIFGELALRRHLFPGRSDQHQLQLIFEGCGVPDNSTWPNVTQLPNWRPFGRVQSQLRDLFVSALPQEGINLITELLSLNPAGRPTAERGARTTVLQGLPDVSAARTAGILARARVRGAQGARRRRRPRRRRCCGCRHRRRHCRRRRVGRRNCDWRRRRRRAGSGTRQQSEPRAERANRAGEASSIAMTLN
jgi:hypothetical protein